MGAARREYLHNAIFVETLEETNTAKVIDKCRLKL
jgi:hypothetical protein